jgi:hypothetical protein
MRATRPAACSVVARCSSTAVEWMTPPALTTQSGFRSSVIYQHSRNQVIAPLE